MKTFIAYAIAVAASLNAAPVQAAPIYDVKDGKLFAIRGIVGSPFITPDENSGYNFTINGVTSSYYTDIEFVDGNCKEVAFCNNPTSATSNARRIPSFASDLLRTGVEVNGKVYNFATAPDAINGCSSMVTCNIHFLQDVREAGRSSGVTIEISAAGLATKAFQMPSADTSTANDVTYGVIKTYRVVSSSPAVPEPSTWAMMMVGFGLVGGAARYRRRSAKAAIA